MKFCIPISTDMQISHLTVKVLQYFSTGFNTVELFFTWLYCWSWTWQMRPSSLVLALWDFLDIHKNPSKPHISTYSKNAGNSKYIGSSQSHNSAFGRVESIIHLDASGAHNIYIQPLGENKKSDRSLFFHYGFNGSVLTDTPPLQQMGLLSPQVVFFEHNV